MKRLQPVVETVVTKSVIDQILEVPLETLIICQPAAGFGDSTTVLHRTGLDGWLITRSFSIHLTGGKYHKTYAIKRMLEAFEQRGGWFTVVGPDEWENG